jgi:nicotinate phosphoribosyltransferase
MPESQLIYDRYHLTMGNFALTERAKVREKQLANLNAVFYTAQRKMPFAPCVGHERLLESLTAKNLGRPRLRFLEADKANLNLIAQKLASAAHPFRIRCVRPGTITFAGEPFADIEGPFTETQMAEILFEHAFDEPITTAGNALAMRLEAGDRWLSDFSLRRDGNLERACEVAKYAYIGGFDDTSNMEAAYRMDINAVGTMAHFLIQAFSQWSFRQEGRHFEQLVFERWLDAHPKGTTLLVDTISTRMGVIHAIKAALSNPSRKKALKLVRIDSAKDLKGLIEDCHWTRRMLDANGLTETGIIITGDMDAEKIRELVTAAPFIYGFGVGTKLAAETLVAGVTFKLCEIDFSPTMKLSAEKKKETIAGKVQIFRCENKDGAYVMDIIARADEPNPSTNGRHYENLPEFCSSFPLLHDFWGTEEPSPKIPGIEEQRKFIKDQAQKFGGKQGLLNYSTVFSPALRDRISSLTKTLQEDPYLQEGITIITERPEQI